MANTYEQILALANKNNMGLSNTIKRDYGIPLDYSSVQETYEAALAYAQSSTLAYIGQPISVGDTLYIVTDEANGYLKAVGTKPTGDDASISVAEDGKISLFGYAAADNATLPRKKADGTLEWVAIDAIVSGDGNEKTRVEVAEDSAISVTPSYDATNDTYTYTLDVTLPAVPGYSVTKTAGESSVTYQLTKDGVAEGEAIVVPNAYDDTALANRVSDVEASITDHGTRISGLETHVNAFFAAVEEPDAVVDTLAEIQKYIADDKTGAAGMLESIQANTQAIAVLNGEDTGSVKKTVNDAVAAQAVIDASTYATQAALSEVQATADAAAVKSEVDEALAKKIESATIAHTSEGVVEGVTVNGTALNIVVDAYTKAETLQKISDKITEINGGESAGEVLGQLNDYKETNDAAISAIQAVDTAQDKTIKANTDAITAINDVETGILAQAKAAAALDAQNKVNALATGAVATNTSDISAIKSSITNINNSISTFTGDIATLQQKDADLTAAINGEKSARETLATTVGEHTGYITALQTKDTELDAAIKAHDTKFNDYSTTAQVEAKIAAAVGAIDHTAINEAIAANTKAISDEATRADTEEKRLAGLISDNAEAIETNASNIADLNTAIQAIIDDKDGTTLNSIKDLAVWVEEHESEVLPAIQDNTDAIALLNDKTGKDGSIQKIVADAIAAIPATPIATTSVAGLVKASSEVAVAEDGTMSISSVSTDVLVQGSSTLVLSGGTATA